MLRVRASTAGQTKKYFSESLTRERYYTEGQEVVGYWGGLSAARLGLEGPVTRDAFMSLCDNRHPGTGEQLTARMKTNRRVSYDFNFNVPKSVSLAYEWHQDERILEAFLLSMRETMADVEKEMLTRVRKNGQDFDRRTGELVMAEFVHFTARPEGGMPDPHFHGHCIVFNMTHDQEEACWKAGQFGEIVRKVNFYQAAFHTRLARRLRELGYETVPVGISFELAGVSRSLIEKFSRRGAKVEKWAKEHGITSAAEKDKVAALTREKKVKDLSKSELHDYWWSRLAPEEVRELDSLGRGLARESGKQETREAVQVPGSPVWPAGQGATGVTSSYLSKQGRSLRLPEARPRERAEVVTATKEDMEAVDFAIKHLFYTTSVVTETDLLTEALKWGCGWATVEGVKEALKEFPLVRLQKNGREYLTTAAVLLEENRIVERCQRGIGKFRAINPGWRIQDGKLNSQQRAAVFHVLTSHEFVTGIIGKAGVGKTTTLVEIARGIEAAGMKVVALAPTAAASRGTLRKAGFANAETVDKLLVNDRVQEQARGAVWLVDESGLLSARLMDRLLSLAERLEARVVPIGDTGQHHSVERGDAFRLLQEIGGMAVVTIDEIQRQKGVYKQAVEQISKRQLDKAFESLERMGALIEIPNDGERYRVIAADLVSSIKKGQSASLIAPTHIECDLVTQQVREALKESGTIKHVRTWDILRNESWSPAQKSDGNCYTPGMVVKVTGHMRGFSLGEAMEVVHGSRDGVVVQRKNGEKQQLPLPQAEKFAVYKRDQIEIGKGDQISITINTRSADGHALENGDNHVIRGFSKDGGIILENGWQLGPGFGHLDYGYADTSHSAQSMNVDRVFIAQSTSLSAGASDAKQFYTSVTRGRESVRIYTDDLEGLRELVARVRPRELATELLLEQARREEQERELVDRNVAEQAMEFQDQDKWQGWRKTFAHEQVSRAEGLNGAERELATKEFRSLERAPEAMEAERAPVEGREITEQETAPAEALVLEAPELPEMAMEM